MGTLDKRLAGRAVETAGLEEETDFGGRCAGRAVVFMLETALDDNQTDCLPFCFSDITERCCTVSVIRCTPEGLYFPILTIK